MITAEHMREVHQAMEDAETVIVEREIDRAVFEQGLQIMRDLAARRTEKIFLAVPGRCLPHASAVETHVQGGLERFQRESHKLSDAGSNPAPATNPNAACYDQVHRYPKGRWT